MLPSLFRPQPQLKCFFPNKHWNDPPDNNTSSLSSPSHMETHARTHARRHAHTQFSNLGSRMGSLLGLRFMNWYWCGDATKNWDVKGSSGGICASGEDWFSNTGFLSHTQTVASHDTTLRADAAVCWNQKVIKFLPALFVQILNLDREVLLKERAYWLYRRFVVALPFPPSVMHVFPISCHLCVTLRAKGRSAHKIWSHHDHKLCSCWGTVGTLEQSLMGSTGKPLQALLVMSMLQTCRTGTPCPADARIHLGPTSVE